MKNKTKILNQSESFNLTREALKAKQKQLKQQGKWNKPKRACPLTNEEINILYNKNVRGSHTPQSLLSTHMPSYG
jgi:DNA invertase Pin-like site-specific DNA recombinase